MDEIQYEIRNLLNRAKFESHYQQIEQEVTIWTTLRMDDKAFQRSQSRSPLGPSK